jgi:ABC-type antimicrobial peptide transport system permease subunit
LVTDISDKTFVVVGVTRNTAVSNLNPDPGTLLYLPLYQLYRPAMTLQVRVAGNRKSFTSAVTRTAQELNADLLLHDLTTLKITIRLATCTRIAGTFVGIFGMLALVLAAVGVYGVIAYSTRQRTRELALRLTFGADRGRVFRLVLGQGMHLALIGIAIGLAVSVLLTRFLKGLLVGVTSTDLLTFSALSVLFCLVTLLACFVPAWRATRWIP